MCLSLLPLNKCLILSAGSFIDGHRATCVVKHVLKCAVKPWLQWMGEESVANTQFFHCSNLIFGCWFEAATVKKKRLSHLNIEEICSENHKSRSTGTRCSTQFCYKYNQTITSLPWELLWHFFFQIQSQTSYRSTQGGNTLQWLLSCRVILSNTFHLTVLLFSLPLSLLFILQELWGRDRLCVCIALSLMAVSHCWDHSVLSLVKSSDILAQTMEKL